MNIPENIKKLGLNAMSDESIEQLLEATGQSDVTVQQFKEQVKQEEEKGELIDAYKHLALPSLCLMFKKMGAGNIIPPEEVKFIIGHDEIVNKKTLHIILLETSAYDKMKQELNGPEVYDTKFFIDRITANMDGLQFRKVCGIIMQLLGYVYSKYTDIYNTNKKTIVKCLGGEKESIMLLNKQNFTLTLVKPGFEIGIFVLYDEEKKFLDFDTYLT